MRCQVQLGNGICVAGRDRPRPRTFTETKRTECPLSAQWTPALRGLVHRHSSFIIHLSDFQTFAPLPTAFLYAGSSGLGAALRVFSRPMSDSVEVNFQATMRRRRFHRITDRRVDADFRSGRRRRPSRTQLGVAHIGGRYSFSETDYLNEGAATARAIGARCIKVSLSLDRITLRRNFIRFTRSGPPSRRSMSSRILHTTALCLRGSLILSS